MFYRQTEAEQLSRAQMDMARKAFRGKLVRLRFSPQFIVNNGDELLAIAHSEYARAVQRGVEIEDPVAWTVHCAWRRTQNLLQSESTRPRIVSSEKVAELIDDGRAEPEEQALEGDRAQKIREAVARLDEDQRKVIALTFFEDMSVREAARHLGCSASSVQHRRETALRTLRRFLPFRTGDDIVIDFAMACWLSLAVERSGFQLPAGFEAVLDRAGHGASGLWGRAQDLARRLTVGSGTDTATAVASGGAGRAAGICATAAIVCLAGAGSGLVGPGIAGLGGGHQEPPPRRPQVRHEHYRHTAAPTTHSAATPVPAEEPSTEQAPPPTATGRTSSAPSHRARQRSAASSAAADGAPSKAHARHEEAAQVEGEFSGIAQAGEESSTAAPPAAAASDQGTEAPTVVHTGGGDSHSAAAAEEFGFER